MPHKGENYCRSRSRLVQCIHATAILFMLASLMRIRLRVSLVPDKQFVESQSTIARTRENRGILNQNGRNHALYHQ
jgi:hypothetical protein